MTEPTEDAVDSDFDELELPEEDNRDNSSIKGVVIPYRAVHAQCLSFKTPNRKCFIPGRPIVIKIIDVERTVSTHYLNPNLYIIQIQHGEFMWTVKRRYKHFQHLHQQLQLYRATLSIPFPTRTHRERRLSYKTSIVRDESGKSHGLPRFPKKPEALISSDQLAERTKILESYLQNLLKIKAFKNHHETLEFLEVSHLSFVHGLGVKGKEGLILKRTGTTQGRRCTCVCGPFLRMLRCFGDCCGQWQKRWLIAKDTFVAYVRPKDGTISCVMLFDAEFEISSLYETGAYGVVISNLSRQLVVKCWTKRKSKEWLDYLRNLTTTEAAKGFLDRNRFMSFAPTRRDTVGRWFVDGADYMAAVADALEAAHEEIFIADWWLSPEIYLKRPVVEGERWRLDKILQRKAKQGVKIFVLLYKEVNLALGINSYYSKQKLVEQHPENIKVLRHPDQIVPIMWAHHEKLVIVDQMYAFVGGIDLSYGRWDDRIHRLTDLGSVSKNQGNLGLIHCKKMTSSNPGKGAIASSILQLARATNAVTIGTMGNTTTSTTSSEQSQTVLVKSASTNDLDEIAEEKTVSFAELESNGVVENGIQSDEHQKNDSQVAEVEGSQENELGDTANGNVVPLKGETPPAGRKNFIRKMTKVSRGLKEDGKEWIDKHVRKRRGSNDEESSDESDQENAVENTGGASSVEPKLKKSVKQSVKHHPTVTKTKSESALAGLQGSSKLWIGKDYTNFIVKDFVDLESPFTDNISRNTTPRMPWHDIATMVEGQCARDVSRHFIQRWNAVKEEKMKVNPQYPYLIPKTYDFKNKNVPPVLADLAKSSKVSAQVVRSSCQWNCGIRTNDDSFMQSYIDSIESSKHYIYIENQFFISLSQASAQSVQNRIGEALLQRVLRAHREKTTFRVFVIIPLLPGFEGEVGTARGIAIHAITHWNYSSICSGPDALIVRLEREGIKDPSKYVTFHGLRTHSELHGDLITELIYVHSKLLIVDDNLVICGSANINDRSMLGKRDSEVGIMFQDEEHVDSMMDGNSYKAGKFAYSLRMHLFREHLGFDECQESDLRDPISEDFYRNIWRRTGQKNTEIYDDVFHCVPTDKCQTFAQLRDYQNELPLCTTDSVAARKSLEEIRGHLVMLPLQFLSQENLLPQAGTREALMPTALWT